MFLQRLIPCRSLHALRRLPRLSSTCCKGTGSLIERLNQRFASSTTTRIAGRREKFPERLLIYHAGTGRIVFIGALKLTTIFIATFFCAVAGPSHFYAEDQPQWVAFAVVLSGVIPMLFVHYVSAPFVNYIHLRLPHYARLSRDVLTRYSRSLPKDAEVDVTMMNALGKPYVARMKVSDLYPVKERFGLANYARDTTRMNVKRKWWLGKAVRQFGVHNTRGDAVAGDIWNNVAALIAKNYGKRTPAHP